MRWLNASLEASVYLPTASCTYGVGRVGIARFSYYVASTLEIYALVCEMMIRCHYLVLTDCFFVDINIFSSVFILTVESLKTNTHRNRPTETRHPKTLARACRPPQRYPLLVWLTGRLT